MITVCPLNKLILLALLNHIYLLSPHNNLFTLGNISTFKVFTLTHLNKFIIMFGGRRAPLVASPTFMLCRTMPSSYSVCFVHDPSDRGL